MDSNALLICVGGLPSLSYQYSGQAILVVMGASVRAVFNEVLGIYERYGAWNRSLERVLSDGGGIQEMLELTAPLLMNDVTVIDGDLHILAAVSFEKTADGLAQVVKRENVVMPVSYVEKYKASIAKFRNNRSSFMADEGCYCINLYSGESLLGNLSLFPMMSELRPSDMFIMDELAVYIRAALQMRGDTKKWRQDQFESVVQKLLDGEFVEEEILAEYNGTSDSFPDGRFVCLCIQATPEDSDLTLEYVQAVMAANYTNLALAHVGDEHYIVKDFAGISRTYDEFVAAARVDLQRLGLQAGLSNRFHRLTKLRFHFSQAQNALRFAQQEKRTDSMVLFSEYALQYLMFNSPGIFPAEYVCPQSLIKLRKYDNGSSVDYWDTLRTYLDNQMSIADTARALGVHRNTLIQRIERIADMLENDLGDPMFRLWLRVSIYLFDWEERT